MSSPDIDEKELAKAALVDKAQAELAPQSPWSFAIDFLSAIGLAVFGFVNSKERMEKQQKKQKAQATVENYVLDVLSTIQQTGLELIKAGLQPGTELFETNLKNNLYDVVGYKGNCEADIWAPDTVTLVGNPERPIWFSVRNRGASLATAPALIAPNNLSTLWYNSCRSIRDGWMQVYINKLRAEGREAEIKQIQSDYFNINVIYWLFFGGILSVLVMTLLLRSRKVAKRVRR